MIVTTKYTSRKSDGRSQVKATAGDGTVRTVSYDGAKRPVDNHLTAARAAAEASAAKWGVAPDAVALVDVERLDDGAGRFVYRLVEPEAAAAARQQYNEAAAEGWRIVTPGPGA